MISKINKTLVIIESYVAAFSLILMLALSIIQIIARNFFDVGFPDIDVINRNLLVVCGMMGAVLATSHMQHIKVDVLTTVLDRKILDLIRCPVSIFTALVCAVMCYYSVIFFMDEWQYAPPNLRWTLPFKLIYPTGFFLLSLHFILLCRKRPE